MKIALMLVVFLFPGVVCAKEISEWHEFKTPTKRAPNVYGSYYAGCMDGGLKLSDSGKGYVFSGKRKRRAYGQPAMIDYISHLGEMVHNNTGGTLVIGDLSNPRGGPAPLGSSLHQSHQNGLDVDIWLRTAKPEENAKKIKQVSMVDHAKQNINPKYWNDNVVAMLKRAASFHEVDRIFINPVIKKELCRLHAGEAWMKKVRSWWGHDSHFHVRLKCPKGNTACVTQAPVPDTDGCGEELDWWFSDESTADTTWQVRKEPKLPDICAKVFFAD